MKRRSPIKFRLGKEAASGNVGAVRSPVDRSSPIAQGVPLARLIKRELVPAPELVMLSQPRSIHAERFRRLKTTLAHLQEAELRVIVVSSGAPEEGKSTVSINLALACASDMDERTLLIDADLRRPALSRYVKPNPQIGLSHIVSGQADEEHAILRLEQTPLEFLPAGEIEKDPLNLFSSSAMKRLIEGFRERYDHVIIDTPPVVPFTDADAIGSYSDGVLLVVRAGVTTESVVQQAIDAITSAPVLGTVLNDLQSGSFADWGKTRGRYHDKYYAAYYGQDRKGE